MNGKKVQSENFLAGGTGVAQLPKHQLLDLSSCLDLRVMNSNPTLGFKLGGGEST